MSTSDPKGYSASNIQVLEGLEAVRKRPAMYIGDVGMRGLHHLVYEVVDNSIDEALAGYCSEIEVWINEDNSITVRDNGRGIPVDFHEKEQKSALEVVMTVLHAGGKFDKDTYKVSGGLHGVGVSCVNALSEMCKVNVYRDGKIYSQTYHIGIPEAPVKEVGVTDRRGTETVFLPDKSIFTESVFKFEVLASRLRELSFLNKGIKISLTDSREVIKVDEETGEKIYLTKIFYSEGGLIEFVKYLDSARVPMFDPPIYISGADENGETPVELAILYNDSYVENIHSYVNNINTHEGGTHISGFKKALTRSLKAYADKSGLLNKLKIEITGDDFREGITCVISVKVAEPQFEGQTKGKLGSPEVESVVNKLFSEALVEYFEKNPSIFKMIAERALRSARARAAAKKASESIKRQGFLGKSGSLPGKLSDCDTEDVSISELFLVEGDSAAGSSKGGRNPITQAILPIRGKIINPEKNELAKLLANEEVSALISAIGTGIRDDFKIEDLRYGKVIIMTDADDDGAHIAALLMTFFYRFMRPLVLKGHLYLAKPPLYRVTIKNVHNYIHTEEELNSYRAKYGDKIDVTRFKGLGEISPDEFKFFIGENIRLEPVVITKDIHIKDILEFYMGKNTPDRQDFIIRNLRVEKDEIVEKKEIETEPETE